MKYCPTHDHNCMVTYYNPAPCYECEQASECENCIALNDFIICPGCNGESNREVDVTCGICGCAGIIPKDDDDQMS